MELREIIETGEWIEGSGWRCSNNIADAIIDVSGLSAISLKFWPEYSSWDEDTVLEDVTEPGMDNEIRIKWYRPDYDPLFDDNKPLAVLEAWETEIFQKWKESKIGDLDAKAKITPEGEAYLKELGIANEQAESHPAEAEQKTERPLKQDAPRHEPERER